MSYFRLKYGLFYFEICKKSFSRKKDFFQSLANFSKVRNRHVVSVVVPTTTTLNTSLFTNSIIMCNAHNVRLLPDVACPLYSLSFFILVCTLQTTSNILEPKCFIAFVVRFMRTGDFRNFGSLFFYAMDGRL